MIKKQIIIFPGQVNSPFFSNEIGFIKEYFDIIAIFSYDVDKKRAQQIIIEHGIDVHKLYIVSRLYLNPIYIFRWLMRYETKKEIRNILSNRVLRIKRLGYMLYYGLFALSVDKYISKLSFNSENLCLYSFWMSKGAYTIAYLKEKNSWNNVVTVCRAHRYDLYTEINKTKYLPFREYINDTMNQIAFISEQGKEYFNKKFSTPVNKCVYYLGTTNSEHIKKKIVTKDELCIASCSTVIEVKRIDYIISLLEKLDGIRIRWIHLGDGQLMQNMKQLAEKKLRNTTIHHEFLGGVENDQVLKIYQKYDVDFFVNLSDSEGLPVSIMEAISMGIPVIARAVGGVDEIITWKTGLLLGQEWDEQNWKKVKKFISCRFDDVKQYQKYSDMSYTIWNEKFMAEKNYKSFFSDIYKL